MGASARDPHSRSAPTAEDGSGRGTTGLTEKRDATLKRADAPSKLRRNFFIVRTDEVEKNLCIIIA
jgi:hypothetical protein